MNKAKLKTYAPQARRDFMNMIRQRADLLGLTRKEIEQPQITGDIALIEGRPYPKRYAGLHKRLAEKIRTEGLEQFIERIAYSWFNRFAALRFMEVNNLLSHGFRVLSSREAGKNEPEILTHAAEIELPGLDKNKVIELKLAGNKDAELYRQLLIAQCNELHRAMPFLFEKINDETEILLPDNLLHSDSVIRKMVAAIDEEDWAEVEIIGWLYQFYISEKKDEVIGKTVKSEDIPAATQLFTPNWIVKYMTQNSLGRLWLEANPHSQLARNMEFYISQGARDEGQGVREGEKKNDGSEFQGFGRVAESDGFGSDGLSNNEGISEGGALRADESTSTSGGFDSVEHSGGTRAERDGGISQFSLDSQRLTGGSGNSTDNSSTSELSDKSTTKSDSASTNRNQQNAQQSNEKSNLSPLTPNPLPLNPEQIKVLDPACGSGHILVEAYELLKLIYTERGYSSRDIPLLILEKNLFGLDIDERAAQLASFALLMKARRDDRRIFERLNARAEGKGKQIPNVLTIPDSSQLPHSAREIAEMFFSREATQESAAVPIRADGNFLFDEMQVQPSLTVAASEAETRASARVSTFSDSGVSEQNVIDLLELFAQGKTLGSLIRIPHGFEAVVDKLEKAVSEKLKSGNQFEESAARKLEPFVRAAKMLANKYDCVIANPPYMGSKGMNAELKAFAKKNFPDSKSDLFAMFIERGFELAKKDGFNAMVTMQSWMFLSSFENLREKLLSEKTILTMAHLGARAFAEISGEVVQTTAFVMLNKHFGDYKPTFFRLVDLSEPEKITALRNGEQIFNNTKQDDFKKIPGSPIAYWVSDKVRGAYEKAVLLKEIASPKLGMRTGDNERFLRRWFEIDFEKVGLNFGTAKQAQLSEKKWFPYNKGGDFRKWYGNNEYFVNWEDDGYEIKQYTRECYPQLGDNLGWKITNEANYFLPCVIWSRLSSSYLGVRKSDSGFLFDTNGSAVFPKDEQLLLITGFLCSKISYNLTQAINPTLALQPGDIGTLPILENEVERIKPQVDEIVEEAVSIARADWDSFETSWDFKRLQIVDCALSNETNSVEECWKNWKNLCDERITRMQFLETENNRLFIEAYGLEDELSPEVPLEQITLARADAGKDTRRLLSYFIGCLMGRYSLDEEGLIYADAGGKGFDPTRYKTFPADDDGIVPVTDMEWFPQDAARQFEKFVETVWGKDSLSENLRWIAAQLGAKTSETPTETIRRYFSQSFFKDHLQTYKKRPIYWLFSSGKQKAFECLVYLHRYNEATLARMRHEYVLPLMSKLTAQIETIESLTEKAETTSERNKLTKQLEVFRKKQVELAAFDEKLRHLADRKISLDLDDGVKVNYGKFGDLLAEVKQVAATKE